jgi:lipopolysaccharide export system protein LptA
VSPTGSRPLNRFFKGKRAWPLVFFLSALFLFWLIFPAFKVDLDPVGPTDKQVEVFDTVIRGYENAKLRWQVKAKTVWTGYNPFLFRGEEIGPGVVFDDHGEAIINDIFSGQVQVNSKTKILYAYDTVSAYFVPRNLGVGPSVLAANDTQKPVRVTAGGLKYIEAAKRTYLTDGVEIMQGKARILPHVSAELDNRTNTVLIADGFQMFLEDMVVSGNQMEIVIDDAISHIRGVTLVREGRPTTNQDMDPRERELRKKTSTLTADNMRVEQHDDTYRIAVSGNVIARQPGKVFIGESGTYDSANNRLSLSGHVRIELSDLQWLIAPERRKTMKNADIQKTLGLSTVITSDHLSFDSESQILVLMGNVHVQQEDKDVRCSKIVYDDREQRVVLSGDVTIVKDGEDALVASTIVVNLNEESYRATGKIQTEFKIKRAKR